MVSYNDFSRKFKKYLKILFGTILILSSLVGLEDRDYATSLFVALIGTMLILPSHEKLFLILPKKIIKLFEKDYLEIKDKQSKIRLKISQLRNSHLKKNYVAIFVFLTLIFFIILVIPLNSLEAFTYSLSLALLITWYSNFKYRWAVNHLLRLEEQQRKEAYEERQIILRKKRLEEEKKAKELEEFRKSQEAKGLVEYKDKWGTPEQVEKWKEIEYGINNNFMNISHFEFEGFIAQLFRKMGYQTEVTRKTGDYGIDVIAKDKNDTIAVQVKQFKHGNNVSNLIVQQVLGAMWKVKANKAIIITTSDFTIQAKVQAREAPIELWNLQTLKSTVRKYFIESDKTKQ